MYRLLNVNDFSKTEYDKFFLAMAEDKKEKISRFRFEEDRKRSILGDMLAREMIAKKCEVSPDSIVFKIIENGKPYVENLGIHFNISHSGDYVICAVSESEIGIDIEKIKEVKDGLTEYICTEEEKNYIASCKDKEKKQRRFFEIWTAKEAYFKFLGTGLGDLKSINSLDEEFKIHLKTFSHENYIISIYK